MATPMPNLFIVGAMKSATTSLWKYLGEHPEIYMSPVKEPRYLAVKGFPPDKLEVVKNHPLWNGTTVTGEAYRELFEGVTTETVVGEASPLYMVYPYVAESIRELSPAAKIIASVRHPVERAFSHYLHNYAHGFERRNSFEEAFYADARENYAGYFRLGFYARQLKPFFDAFGSARVKVCLYEDLVADAQRVLGSIFEFLDVDSGVQPDSSVAHLKRSSEETLRPEVKRLLTTVYMEDISALERMTGIDLRQWWDTGEEGLRVTDEERMYSPYYYVPVQEPG